MAAARGNVQYYCTEHLALPVTLMSSLSILKKKKNQAGPRAPTSVFSPDTWILHSLWPQILLCLETLEVVQGSGRQSGVLEFPDRPKSTPPEHS